MKSLLILCISLISVSLIAQEQESSNNLLLDGFLKIESGEKLASQKIEIKSSGGHVLEFAHSDEEGRFKVYFPFDEVRELWFSHTGYHTKILVVDTRNVPKSEREWGFEYGGFNVKLEPIGLGNQKTTKVAVIQYSQEVQNFDLELLSP